MALTITQISRTLLTPTAAAWTTVSLPGVPSGVAGFAFGRVYNTATGQRQFGYRMPGDTTNPIGGTGGGYLDGLQVSGIAFPFNASGQTQIYREAAAVHPKIDFYLTGSDVIVLAAMQQITGLSSGDNQNFDLTSQIATTAHRGNIALLITQDGHFDNATALNSLRHVSGTRPLARNTRGRLTCFDFLNSSDQIDIYTAQGVGPYIMGYILASADIVQGEVDVTPTTSAGAYGTLSANIPTGFKLGFFHLEHGNLQQKKELRAVGSADEDYGQLGREHSYEAVIADSQGRIEVKRADTTIKVWRLGYARSSTSGPPAAPTLSSPANAATNQPLNVTLSWNSVADADTYRVQVANNNTFTSPHMDVGGIVGTSQVVSPNLAYATTYYWRVLGQNENGNGAWSSTRSFTTQPAPSGSITSPANNATVSGSITVSASVTGTNIQGVQFKLSGANLGVEDTAAPYEGNWNTAEVVDGAYQIWAVVRDQFTSVETAKINITVANTLSATVTSPVEGATVSGTITVTATASGPSVLGVQFKLDGVNLGAEDTTSPYSVSWNTTTASEGSHSLIAVARNASGTATSPAVTVIVDNVLTSGDVLLLTPHEDELQSGV